MSDILIKDMEMPRSCGECYLSKTRRSSLGDIIDCKYIGTVGSAFKDPYNILNTRHPKCPLVEVHEEYGDLIDKAKLYEKVAEWEAQALQHASKLLEANNVEEWRRWTSILNERTAFKHDVADAPVVIEGNME